MFLKNSSYVSKYFMIRRKVKITFLYFHRLLNIAVHRMWKNVQNMKSGEFTCEFDKNI